MSVRIYRNWMDRKDGHGRREVKAWPEGKSIKEATDWFEMMESAYPGKYGFYEEDLLEEYYEQEKLSYD